MPVMAPVHGAANTCRRCHAGGTSRHVPRRPADPEVDAARPLCPGAGLVQVLPPSAGCRSASPGRCRPRRCAAAPWPGYITPGRRPRAGRLRRSASPSYLSPLRRARLAAAGRCSATGWRNKAARIVSISVAGETRRSRVVLLLSAFSVRSAVQGLPSTSPGTAPSWPRQRSTPSPNRPRLHRYPRRRGVSADHDDLAHAL